MKTRRMHHIIIFSTVQILLAPCAGCQKGLTDPADMETTVNILFDWSRNEDFKGVEGMKVIFNPADTRSSQWRFDIPGAKGGSVEVPLGDYTLTCYNNDTSGIIFNDSPGDDPTATIATSDGIYLLPSMLYSCEVQSLHASPCGVSYAEPGGEGTVLCPKCKVKAFPEQRTCRYTVIISDADNLENVESIKCSLAGMAPAVRLADGSKIGEAINMTFPSSFSVDDRSIVGQFTNFGYSPGSENTLQLNIRLKNDRKFVATYNVTGQIVNSKTPLNVLILLQDLDIPSEGQPDPPIGEGGFEPGVSGWNVVETDILY